MYSEIAINAYQIMISSTYRRMTKNLEAFFKSHFSGQSQFSFVCWFLF